MLVVIAIIAVLIGLLLPAVQKVREGRSFNGSIGSTVVTSNQTPGYTIDPGGTVGGTDLLKFGNRFGITL